MKKTTFCTLFESHYHYGVAALANSLLANGYEGDLWVGHKDALPDWLTQHAGYDKDSGALRVGERFSLRFVRLETQLFLAYYKPTFMREVLDKHAPHTDAVAYVDPDIVVKCPWSNLRTWFEGGIALVEDVNWNLPPRHPKRLMWNDWFAPHGAVPRRSVERYYNSGFVGVPREHADFLALWSWLCDLVNVHNARLQHIKAGDASDLFHSTDQDALNFALMAHEAPLNTTGPDAMDFVPGGYYFSHAIGWPKPWRRNHFLSALKGYPPSVATKAYYGYANDPIRPYAPWRLALRRLNLHAASFIGRFYRKS